MLHHGHARRALRERFFPFFFIFAKMGCSRFNVIDYRLIEEIAIILSLENTKKEVICPKCGKLTDKVNTNNYQTVRDLPFAKQIVYLKINRRQMRCPHCKI